MKRNRWQEITDLYDAAVELPENERAAFLETCTDDDVRREVQSLLANEKDVHSIFQSSAVGAAAKVGIKPRESLAGKELGSYQLTSELGRGGMGEVYRAKDQKLGRDVAIKVLPEEFALDADRVARFQREARLLASLNHPNIAAIHGLEASDGIHFLVLELVEGETLADRLKRGRIPVEEALQLALQIAEALEAAHGKRVIHRDLKPANISVNPDGKVKVLDFGLAKALAEEQQTSLSDSPTVSAAASLQGVILGTAAYMSPEQARGKAVDKRADIWAFGCVLYEMLSGRPVFSGEDVSDLLSAVIRAEPDWSSLPAILHWRLREVIQRCLAKDPRNRYHDISDVRLDIQKALDDPGGLPVPVATAAGRRLPLRWAIAAMVLTGAIAVVAVWKLMPSEPRQVMHFDYDLPEDHSLFAVMYPALAVSPDGKQFIYCTSDGLYLRAADELQAKLITGTEGKTQQPFFSPDGQWVGYWSSAEGKLKKIGINGGVPVTLCDVKYFRGGSWGIDGMIVYSTTTDGLMRISADGGTPEVLIKLKSGYPLFPQILPDGESVLYTAAVSGDVTKPSEMKIMIQSLKSGKPKELFAGVIARYISTGHVTYQLSYNNNLFAVPFDLDRQAVTGGAVAILKGVYNSGAMQYAVSESGTLAYVPAAFGRTLAWVDREGKEEALGAAPDNYQTPRISPDGKMVALSKPADRVLQIWSWDLVRKTMARVTYDTFTNTMPVWTTDGKRVVFASSRDGKYGLYCRAANGTGETQTLASAPDLNLIPSCWSSDGKTLAMQLLNPAGTLCDIGVLSTEEEDHPVKLLLHEQYVEAHPDISTNGKYIAYTSLGEIYVRPFPDVNKGSWQISAGGGESPLWSPDGRELFYRGGGAVMAVPVDTMAAFKPGMPRKLFQDIYVSGYGDSPAYDISPDGKRFLMIKQPEGPRQINIILNWTEELKKRVPSR